jgi:polyisoprenyl-teichoic acid--peptidoglycan teichoic acid transferase
VRNQPEGTERFDAPVEGTPSRSRYVPAVLDAVIPGLGHLAAGRRQRALLFLAPVLLALVAAVVIVVSTSAPKLGAELIQSEVIWGLLIFQGLLLVWRLLAVGASLFAAGMPRPGRRDALPIAILMIAVIAPQVFAGYVTNVARESADEVFVDQPPVAVVPSGSAEPDPSFLETPSPTPSGSVLPSDSPSPTPGVPRINAVIVGVDSGRQKIHTYSTDTMIVVSFDPVTGSVSEVSVPRDMVDVPLKDGRTFRGKINGLVAYARNHPKQFPGSDGTGFDILRGALGKLLGLDIPYYAVVNLPGFVDVINTLGGVNVNVAHAFCDPTYSEFGYQNGFSIDAGKHHLNGNQALAYARVRHASGESDFTRAARQQEILAGIRDAVERGGFLNDPIGLLKALGTTISTNLPRSKLPDLADLAADVSRSDTYRSVITHPLVKAGFDDRGSIQLPVMKRITALANAIFPPSGTLPDKKYLAPKAAVGAPNGSGVTGCGPAKTPKPTKKPTPKPTAKPSVSASDDSPTPSPSPSAP